MLKNLIVVWFLTQLASMAMLWIGSSIQANRLLLWLGETAHKRKMEALDRFWPLTLIQPAVERQDATTCIVVLSSLILLKSLGCLVLGVVVVFWLPFASLLIPSIVAVHDPHDTRLLSRVRKVALLQVTSHSLAAAIGFAVSISLWRGFTMSEILASLTVPLAIGMIGSVGFAVATGKAETDMLFQHGL
ncbi:MAG: hypothetical protein AAGD38_04895 [Acidobacteriota bacterium]